MSTRGNIGAAASPTTNRNIAIQFTTGNHPGGYEVDKVRLLIASSAATPRVSIYSDSSGEPGASLKTLANPSTVPTSLAWADFDAGDYRLSPSTSYWIVIERASGSGEVQIRATESTAEDAGSAEGWSIGNRIQLFTVSSGQWSSPSNFRFIPQMIIRGRAAATTTAATDATLSALALTDASDNAVALTPAFASDTTSYRATVANSVSQIKVEPTANDSNATIEYLDDSGSTLADDDTNTAVFDFDLSVGTNVVKVKVTAPDGTTSRTYTVTVTRVDFLVSNLGQTEGGTYGLNTAGTGSAVQIMTGSHALGYNISKVRLTLGSPDGITPRVSIYSDNSGRPGSSLKVLINPTVIPTSRSVIEFDAEDYALDADTTYWVAVEREPGTGGIVVSYTGSADEDPGSAADWSTGDFLATRGGGVWIATNFDPLQVAILGTVDTTPNNPPTGKPTISGTPESGQTLTPSTANIRDADGISNPRYVYSWIRVDGGTENLVQFASSPNYLLTDDDVGKKIKVAVRYFDDGGRNERVESNLYPASGNIRNKPNRPPTGSPTIAGKAEVGHTLTASTSGIGDPDGLNDPGFTYQWQRLDGGVYADITGATGMLYRLGTEDEGKRVRVKVTFTDDDGNRHSLTSARTGEVEAQTSIPSDKVEVSLDETAYVVNEGDTLQVTVTLAEAHDEDGRVLIPFTVTPAGGATKADFRAKSSYYRHVRFDAGETTDQIEIRTVDDTLDDDDEYLTLCLGDLPEPYAVLVGRDCATIVIIDNDDPNSVEVAFGSRNYYTSEDGNPAWPRISVYPVPDREITIPITFTRGGGLSAADHSTVTTSVTFGPGLYGEHGDGHLSDNRTYASYPIEIWAIDDSEDDDGEYMDLAFGNLPPFVSQETTNYRGYTESRVWFHDNEFTEVPVTNRPNTFLTSRRLWVNFADTELEATEGDLEYGRVATVRVWLGRHRDLEREVTIPITVTPHGGATPGVDYLTTDIPSQLTFKPGQTEHTFRVVVINDDVDDDGEWLTVGFGTLPERVSTGGTTTTRIDLVDDDDPPVQVSFAQSNYAAAITSRENCCVYARLDVTVNLSAAPERFVHAGIVAESIRGDGDIYLAYAAYIPRRPHRGATFDADETEFTVTVVMSAVGEEFDANQTYRLRFVGVSDRVSVGTLATATITVSGSP